MALKFLLDTSAWRLSDERVARALEGPLTRFEIATCGVTLLEFLVSARNGDEAARTLDEYRHVMPYLETHERHFARAQEVLVELARRGAHRSVKLPDLLVAVVAEERALTVLHYDADFDEIAAVTGQQVQWVVPRGSL